MPVQAPESNRKSAWPPCATSKSSAYRDGAAIALQHNLARLSALIDAALHKPLGIVTLLRISSTNGAIVTGRLL
ncbi:hypothetical protein [Mesorhizobium sp.]|uniref:hypothetical protein n=1 Tax=Mesorhizobium sp. TaxID=1871066 RepID=UPI000FE87627|nr:hypothetical protein [Mesorhizobium sp.]RWN14040.1 MAG: hypothetical protein EOR87_08885 [Mesorhizobium sp.]